MFQTEIPMIYLQILGVNSLASGLNGSPTVTVLIGGSVDKAIAAKVSMIRLIHKSYTALNGDSPIANPPISTVKRHEIFTVT
jgi:hypothetical protein